MRLAAHLSTKPLRESVDETLGEATFGPHRLRIALQRDPECPKTIFFRALRGEEILGELALDRPSDHPSDPESYLNPDSDQIGISNVEVDPSVRRLGIAAHLKATAEQELGCALFPNTTLTQEGRGFFQAIARRAESGHDTSRPTGLRG